MGSRMARLSLLVVLGSLALSAHARTQSSIPLPVPDRDKSCRDLQAAMERIDLDATWSITVELGETARQAFGQDVHRGAVRVVARGDQLWASVHWEPLGMMQESSRETVVRGGLLPVLSRVGVSSDHTVSLLDSPNLGSVSEDLPILAQLFSHIPSVAFPTLRQAMLAYPADAIEVQSGGRLLLRVTALGGTESGVDSALVLETDPILRLQAIWSLATRPVKPIGDDPVANGGEAHVTAWERVGNTEIPARLERTNYAWFPNRDAQDAQRTIYELTSSGRACADPDQIVDLMEWLKPGAVVSDDRVGAIARIGDDTLSLGGTRHRLRRPLTPQDVLGSQQLTFLCVGESVAFEHGMEATVAGSLPSMWHAVDWRNTLVSIAVGLGIMLWIVAIIRPAGSTEGVNARMGGAAFRRLPRVLGLVMIIGGAADLLWQGASAPSVGPLYDLGRVLVTEGTGVADGVVEFACGPTGDREIVSLVPSCGCLTARLPATRVRPVHGHSVPVSLRLSSGGERSAFLTALLDDGTHEIVHVKATGVVEALAAKPQLSSSVLMLGSQGSGSLVALVQRPRWHAPVVRWRLPPEVEVTSANTRFLAPMQAQDPGVWEITTMFVRNDSEERALVGAAVMEIDGAQAASAVVIGE